MKEKEILSLRGFRSPTNLGKGVVVPTRGGTGGKRKGKIAAEEKYTKAEAKAI